MIISSFELTLIYPNSTTWFVGGFPSSQAALAWFTAEQAKPYWIQGTTYNLVDKSYTYTAP